MKHLMNPSDAASQIVDQLQQSYRHAVETLRADLHAYLTTGTPPSPSARQGGAYTYPGLRLTHSGDRPKVKTSRAYARLSELGVYATTVTRPDLFRDYLVEQLGLLIQDYGV